VQSAKTEVSARLPNFFIVGAPKCATTSMDNYLGQHPDIFMCPHKEIHYFADDLYPQGSKCSWARYREFFANARNEAIVGESSVFYMLSQTAAQAIRDFCPEAKILIMLRNPVDVIAAHHSQILYECYETEKSLRRALELEQVRRKVFAGQSISIRDRVTFYREIVAFSSQIQRYLERFSRDQIHFVIYDDLKKDSPFVYKEVLRFLGVDPNFEPSYTIENANKILRSSRIQIFLRETPDWVTRGSRYLLPSAQWRYRLKTYLKKLNSKPVAREAMPDDLRVSLARELLPEIDRLSNLLDRDLTHWCR
jgi:hypothetical protein